MVNSKFSAINKCRSCGSKNLEFILSLGTQFVSAFVDSNNEGFKAPLDLVLCNVSNGGCGLLQLKHDVSLEAMYKQYWYKSGTNKSMADALANITFKAEKLVKLSEKDLVLDIGCNDGTLLRSYKNKGILRIGFEPASNLIQFASVGTTLIINDFFNFNAFEKFLSANNFGKKKAKIITSIAMFYDLQDPNFFVSDIVKCLDENGLWIIQMSYLPLMLEQNAFDNICHEHLEYYSLIALENLLKKHALKVFDCELNDVNGGSFRIYIKHNSNKKLTGFEGAENRLKDLREEEKKLKLNEKNVYAQFAERINELKNKTADFIRKKVKNGKTVYVYGASTKGNVLLQYYGLNSDLIKAAVERNPDKWGKKTVGTLIPIISEEQARKDNPDYFLILPWHFLKEFKEREKNYLNSGGKFIVPLPDFQIISSQ